MQAHSSIDETKRFDTQLFFVSTTIILAISTSIFIFNSFISQNLSLLREYHKSVITIAAIFLAFSPAFFAFLYSNDNLKAAIISLKINYSVTRYYKHSFVYSLAFLVISILGIIFSYMDPSNSSTPFSLVKNYYAINGLLFSISIFCFLNLIFWSVLFGQLVVSIVNRVVR